MLRTGFALCAALLVATGVALADEAPEKGEKKAPEKKAPAPNPVRDAKLRLAEVVKQLRALLNGEPRPEDNERVGLRYDFQQGDKPAFDFEAKGFELAIAHGRLGRGKTRCIELTAGGEGSFLHRIPFKGDVEWEVEFYVRSYELDSSSLTFVAEVDAKTKKWVGARWGQQLASFDGKRVSTAGPAVTFDDLGSQPRWVTRLSRRGDKVSLAWNGVSKGSVTLPVSADGGRVGLVGKNVKLGILSAHVVGAPVLDESN